MILSKPRQDRAEQQTQYWVEKAATIFDQSFKSIEVRFDLRGRTSGMFCAQGKQYWIRYNPWIFEKHYDESLAITVPHEVAHYVCHLLYGKGRKRPKPHGREWKSIMSEFGIAANATCKLDISDLPQKRLKRFSYECSCNNHQLTSIRHNRIVRGLSSYMCPKCKSPLLEVSSGN